MATTVHLPKDLLRRVDERAKALGVSRNRFIRTAIEEKIAPKREWPPELVDMLTARPTARVSQAVEKMVQIIESSRRNRSEPPEL